MEKKNQTNSSSVCSMELSHGWFDCQICTHYKVPFKLEAQSIFAIEGKNAQPKLSLGEVTQ